MNKVFYCGSETNTACVCAVLHIKPIRESLYRNVLPSSYEGSPPQIFISATYVVKNKGNHIFLVVSNKVARLILVQIASSQCVYILFNYSTVGI